LYQLRSCSGTLRPNSQSQKLSRIPDGRDFEFFPAIRKWKCSLFVFSTPIVSGGASSCGKDSIPQADGVFYLVLKDTMDRSKRCDIVYVKWDIEEGTSVSVYTNWWNPKSEGITAVRRAETKIEVRGQ
jgi:hypothetical protein